MIRLTITLALGFAIVLALAALGLTEEKVDASLAGYWKFEEGKGVIAGDSSPNGSDGDIRGAMWSKSGKIGSCLYFDGTGYVELPNTPALQLPGPITIEAWVKTEDITFKNQAVTGKNSNQQCIVISHHHDTLDYRSSVPLSTFRFVVYTNDSPGCSMGCDCIESGKWYHIVGTYDRENLRAYLDGKEIKHSGDKLTGDLTGYEGHTWQIGAQGTPGENKWFFHGWIDEVKIYNRALTGEEILEHYNSEK